MLEIGTHEWLTADGRSFWHRGVEPDIRAEMPDGAQPVRPVDLAALGATGVVTSGDAQLLAALRVIEATAGE